MLNVAMSIVYKKRRVNISFVALERQSIKYRYCCSFVGFVIEDDHDYRHCI